MTVTTTRTAPAPAPGPAPHRPGLGVAELVLAMVLSGTIGFFVVESEASPQTVAFARCLVGAAVLGLWCLARGHLRHTGLTRASLGLVVAGGVFLVANWVLLFAAYGHTSIGVATVSYHVQPFLVVLLAPLLLREALAWRQLGWVALGFGGLVLIAQPWAEPLSGGYGRGMLEAVGAAALYALATLLVKKVSGVRPHVIALVQLAVGAVLLLPLSDLSELASLDAVPWLVTLGVVHTAVMYVLMYDSYPRLRTPTIAFLGFVYPVVAVAVDALVYDELLSTAQVGGAALILGAAVGRTLVASRVR
ncbi:DMT family transporter [Nocardioides sp. GCM10027113]|uniref:DMT family transporter n=1 Tax=unclassified Nocardioides TaxID=2615069 RepID=UPI00361FF7F7